MPVPSSISPMAMPDASADKAAIGSSPAAVPLCSERTRAASARRRAPCKASASLIRTAPSEILPTMRRRAKAPNGTPRSGS
ncbi:MAG TPA: hypothetical protein VFQ57_00880 [Sphingomonas sp.]|jgi:hypothetical protein|nr:hypothetical protein [Sphingomonas sp.]